MGEIDAVCYWRHCIGLLGHVDILPLDACVCTCAYVFVRTKTLQSEDILTRAV